jgi:hypothetical protein
VQSIADSIQAMDEILGSSDRKEIKLDSPTKVYFGVKSCESTKNQQTFCNDNKQAEKNEA